MPWDPAIGTEKSAGAAETFMIKPSVQGLVVWQERGGGTRDLVSIDKYQCGVSTMFRPSDGFESAQDLGRPLGSLKASLVENSPNSNFHTQTIENSKIGHIGMPADHLFSSFLLACTGVSKYRNSRNIYFQ